MTISILTVNIATISILTVYNLVNQYLLHIYNAAGNNSRKINKLFHVISAGAGVVIYNNKIVAHKRRLINYFELMSSKTM